MKRSLMAAIACGIIATAASAEVCRLPFFESAASYSSETGLFPFAEAWIDGGHVLNQEAEPLFGHNLETGLRLTLFSTPDLAIWLRARENFRFMSNPDSDWLIVTRDLVSDFALACETRLEPFSVAFGFRHDCKHDVDGVYGRDLLHDALFARAVPRGPLALGAAAEVLAAIEAELNLPPVFQAAPPEVDAWRLSGEIRLVPFLAASELHPFVEARGSIIGRRETSGIDVRSGVYADWSASAGAELRGRAGVFRLYLAAEKISDPWLDDRAEGAEVLSFNATFIFAAGS